MCAALARGPRARAVQAQQAEGLQPHLASGLVGLNLVQHGVAVAQGGMRKVLLQAAACV